MLIGTRCRLATIGWSERLYHVSRIEVMNANHRARQCDRSVWTIVGLIVAIWRHACWVAVARASAENFGEN